MTDVLKNLVFGLSVAISPLNLLYCFTGVVFGIIVGALPGLGPSAGIAILLPFTFGMNPTAGIIMLAGIYYGCMYGGSISSILINTPGDSAAVMTTVDGHPMARKGLAGKALGMAGFASFIGGSISVVAFMFLSPVLADYALLFGPAEYTALMVMALTIIGGLTGKSPAKGLISALLGLLISIIGLDLVQGIPRFTMGMWELYGGIDFIPVAMGLFGIAEILTVDPSESNVKVDRGQIGWKKLLPSKQDWKECWATILRGTGIGFFVGMLPGAGATIASFISYGVAKKISRRGGNFGNGEIEGVAAPESANNASSIGAMVPMLTLGVPGSGATAVMMGALIMFNMTPGPMLFVEHKDFVWGLVGSMYIGNLILITLAIIAVPLFVKVLDIPRPILNALIIAFILVGAYCLHNSMFEVGLTVFFGVVGFFMKKFEYPTAPMVLSLVLGYLLENGLRQSLIISNGSLSIFFEKPLPAILLLLSFVSIIAPMLKKLKRAKAS
jgi:putative tricarboxylic transport membrane protein